MTTELDDSIAAERLLAMITKEALHAMPEPPLEEVDHYSPNTCATSCPERSVSPEPTMKKMEGICRDAVRCNACFESGQLKRPYVNIAQPRYIGPGYWKAKKRIALAMLNPGAGEANAYDQEALKLIRAFRDGAPLAPVLEQAREAIPIWAGGRYFEFVKALGLDLDEIALLNIAWCATAGNKYPDEMLDACWQRHTAPLLNAILPNVIVLSGFAAHRYAAIINVKTVKVIHYANRGSIVARTQAIEAARREIEEGGDLMTERLSAWMDGELETEHARQLPSQIKRDAGLRRNWDRYHLIGDALRGVLGPDLSVKIDARLGAEPSINAGANE
ncbi:MAG: RseA family anti-sigma factor [Proteobacteria bacterium]|nr:RseA family anti-sigma factor [Pseudomonadota bacterium]